MVRQVLRGGIGSTISLGIYVFVVDVAITSATVASSR
jgi:hypothetical protein